MSPVWLILSKIFIIQKSRKMHKAGCEDCEQEYPAVQYAKICPHCGSGHTYLLRVMNS